MSVQYVSKTGGIGRWVVTVSVDNHSTIYDRKPEGESLRLTPKAKYSTEYKERTNIRMAAYCRVSTLAKEQETSYETQLEHYRTYINDQHDWAFAGIYADSVSGTRIKGRIGFQQMIRDAKAGKIDMIITKSASRFARNLLDGIKTIRELLQLNPPVGIIFEEENFNTLRPDSELYLSFLFSMAQGESERRSRSIRKAFQWRCDNKNFLTPVDSLLGYSKDGDNKLVIDPEGAKTVKAIFAMFLYGDTATHIAYVLSSSGKKTGKNKSIWSSGSVTNILRNEKFCGDIVAQKTITTDVLEHKSEKNDGREVLHYLDNHHDAIITREEYVRALLLLRSNTGSSYYNPHYEIKAVREGLLKGFIPLNFAFGGYDADHYLGAELLCKVNTGNYVMDIVAASNYRLIRTQEIDHRLAAQATLSCKRIAFNADCIARLPDIEFVEVLLHPAERLLAVRPTAKSNPNAINWSKKTVSSATLCPMLFYLMGWKEYWKYKIMADCFVRGKERVLIFNLSEPEFQFVDDVLENEEVVNRIRRLLQPQEWSSEIGADYISQMIGSRRAYALSLDDWNTQAPALPIEGFPGSPQQRSENDLEEYLSELGVNYVR